MHCLKNASLIFAHHHLNTTWDKQLLVYNTITVGALEGGGFSTAPIVVPLFTEACLEDDWGCTIVEEGGGSRGSSKGASRKTD